ncbi:autotransporter assembly complex protein TamA [Vibrio marisflavi]|uniref:Translocation and assembly module subunit TamA n=1 Tax=Vibrio marisflavi CECT 7928 TaxID=634439 RepID=A0ABN8EBT8_9VIBR|nr:autotransporter assembly complex family protein [Vibrio marisflavi]CAH0541610.1 Translocation and assembly module subunit TamA [Vibrio marisflavi CECT 7928]
MKRKSLPALIIALALPSKALANDVDLSINGLSGDLEKNVDAYLAAIPKSDYRVTLRFQSRLEKSLNEALNAVGYYHAKFRFSVEGKGTKLVVNIKPGKPVLVKKIDFQITGEAKSDPDFQKLLGLSGLKVGEILNHGQYETLKSSIRNLALRKGYFKGEFTESRLEVAPSLNEAFIILHYSSGMRYQFGKTTITGSQIHLSRVRSLQPYKEGDSYLANDITQFNQNLSSTDWFSSVLVTPDLSNVGTNRELPMNVELAPETRNKLETGLGYSTDVGVRGTLKWKKPWLSSNGNSFNSSFSLSNPEQVITLGYKIPLEDVLRDYYLVQYGLKRVDNLDTKSIESNLSFERHWLLDDGWHRTARIRYLVENYEQGEQDAVGHFVLPGMSFTRTRIRGGAMPTWGDGENFTFEYGDPEFFSETRVLRVQGSSSWIRSYGRNQRGLFRIDLGGNFTEDFDKLSPSLRFFAGGDNSIRGYSYDSISPTDSTGALTGAKYLATSSLEYQHRIYGSWWGAVFYDYGDAFNSKPDFKRGTGFGIRWASPVGPIRLDFAWGLDATPGQKFRIHFSLGPEL